MRAPETVSTVKATALAPVLAPIIYAAPALLALTLGRGVWKARGEHGETVMFASTSAGRLLLDGPVVIDPTAPTAETARRLWWILNDAEPCIRIRNGLQ